MDTHSDYADGGWPLETFQTLFAAQGWRHERAGEDEIVATGEGSWGEVELRVLWRPDDRAFQLLAFPGIVVGDEQRARVWETLSLANEQLWLGHFELWTSTGTVLFRHAVPVDEDAEPPLSVPVAATLVDTALDECERFFPVFQFVLWGGKSPAEAMAAGLIDTLGEA